MIMPIKFKSGEYQELTVTRKFTLGGALNISFERGQTILFDGAHANIDGDEHTIPDLRGAVKAGWLVLSKDFDETAEIQRPRAGIKVHSAVNKSNPMGSLKDSSREISIETVRSNDRVAVNVAEHTARTDAINKRRTTTQVISPDGSTTQQEAVVVRPLKTPTKSKNSLTSPEAVQRAIRETDVQVEAQQSAMSLEDRLASMTEEEREEYLQDLAARRAARGLSTEDLPKKATKKEAKVPVQVVEKSPTVGALEGRRAVAKSLCEDFPENYSFDKPLAQRVARLMADYADRKDIILAAFAAETDEGKSRIMQDFPHYFK